MQTLVDTPLHGYSHDLSYMSQKTVYSRNHWRKSLTRNSASAAVTQPELALVTTQHSFCLILNCPFLNPHVVSLLLFQFSPTLLVMEGGGGV